MGQCISGNSNRRRNPGADKYDQEPADTQSLETLPLPKLRLHYLLTRVKLKRCANYFRLGLKIKLADDEIQLKPKGLARQVARWQIRHSSTIEATEYDIRKQFVHISVLDNNKTIGQLKINLYLLATGPYHQDFLLPLPESEGTRVSFNFKASQEVKMGLKIKEAVLAPNAKEYPGDTFEFCIRSILANHVEESEMSYKYTIAFDEAESQGSISSNPTEQKNNPKNMSGKKKNDAISSVSQESKKRKRSMSPNKANRVLKKPASRQKEHQVRDIAWSSQLSNQMPQVVLNVPLFDLHGATFNIIFYSLSEEKADMSSECFISINKLANQAFQQVKDPSNPTLVMHKREVELEMKTWDHGKEAGVAFVKLQFWIQKHIKQMQICVRTEQGILQSSPVFFDDGNSSLQYQIEQLEKLGNDIQALFIESLKSSNSSASSPLHRPRQRWMQTVKKKLKQQRQILLKSDKESKLMFVYQDEKALLKGQRSLIALGFKIRSLLNEEREEVEDICWQLLIALVKRAEFDLAYIGFTKSQVEQCISGKASEFLIRKKEVASSYHTLLVDLLHTTLQSLESCYYESQRQFAELFCAYAYFRLAAFRKVVLSSITRQDDPQIDEWRGTEYSLTQDSVDELGKTTFSIMFDWQNHFEKVISTSNEFQKNTVKLNELLQYNGWQQRMKKRGGAFFAFIRYWVNYVESITINSKHISWRYFPGYNKLLLGFLTELKSRSMIEYPDALKKAATSLLSNEKLLNAFVLILFRKTNNFDQLSVFRSFQLIHHFLDSINKRNRCLPTTFDFKVLLKAIRSVLEGQSNMATAKVLLILYDHFLVFPIEFRFQVSIYLLKTLFFKLFLHWSYSVRTMFHHLLYVRIHQFAHRPLQQMNSKEQQILTASPHYRQEVISIYEKVTRIVENAGQIQSHSKLEKSTFNDQYSALKRKIHQRKNKNHPSSFSMPSLHKLSLDNIEEHYELMEQLSEPKVGYYSSTILEEDISQLSSPQKRGVSEGVDARKSKNKVKRKISYFEGSLQRELIPMKSKHLSYIGVALDEFRQICSDYNEQLRVGKDSAPELRLQMPLDERELRPEGLTQHQEW